MTPRKQNQIAEREKAILKIARDLIVTEGLAALTMERVLERVDFSKGTLYNHFTCREDLLVAHHVQCFAEHVEYFSRGALFRGRPRERFMAAGMGHQVKRQLDPQPFCILVDDTMLAAASERWRDAFAYYNQEAMGVFLGIVRDGIASGDLPADTDPEIVAAATWSTACGADELHGSGLIFRHRPDHEFDFLRSRMIAAMLDGFDWKPLYREHDYDAVRRRVLSEVYGPEARQLGLLERAERTTAGAR